MVTFLKKEIPLLKANLDVYFSISSTSVSKLTKDTAIVLSPELQAQFASLAYDTIRGVFTKTMETTLNNIILTPKT